MTEERDPIEADAERYAQAVFSGDEPGLRWGRRLLKRLPSSPRCKMCASPFAMPLGPVMRVFGKSPWPKNPKYCGQCFKVPRVL